MGKQGLQEGSGSPEQQNVKSADADVWAQLKALAARAESDPVLHLLVNEAISRYEELRGVTATIATRYRSLVDAIPDAVIIHDASGNVLDANEAACRLYRLERESLLQSSMLKLNPGLHSEFLANLHVAHHDERRMTATSAMHHEDGTTSELELHAHEYLDAGRIRIIAVVRDLGPREIEVQQLRESETWLRSVLHQIDMGVVVWSRRGQILSSNPSASRTLRVSEVELRALTPDQLEQWRFIDAEGNPMPKSGLPWIAAIETGKPQESVICGMQLPDMSSTLWLSLSAVPHFNPGDAEPDMVACLFTEVTKLQRDALMFAQSQTLNTVGAWQLDFETQTLLCSAQVHSILDVPMSTPLTRERLLGHFHGHDLDRFRHALTNLQEGGFDQFEAMMTTSIGRKRRVRVRIRPLQSGANVNGIFGTMKDITTESHNTLQAGRL